MRIDKYLTDKFKSRAKAQTAIKKGLVLINGKTVDVSYQMRENDQITFLDAEENYVSAGGYKLAKALKDFCVDVNNKVFADVGASNGGFTDCLFQNGAKKVYCVDVGECQLDSSLFKNNVVVIDNFNAKNLNKDLFQERLDGAVIDVSFISLTHILKPVAEVLDDGAEVYALIKPQFECESRKVGKNGIVKDPKTHEKIIQKIYDFASLCNFAPVDLTNAPIISGKNYEYLVRLVKNGEPKDIKILLSNIKL